uniref:Uncharacterized protein n=1 Tax=Arundo donax TaxID=35708 RepID=A0A0A8YCB1_ARUDO
MALVPAVVEDPVLVVELALGSISTSAGMEWGTALAEVAL